MSLLHQKWHNGTCGLGVPCTQCREEDDVPLDRRHDAWDIMGLEEYERSTRWKSEAEPPDVQPINTEYSSGMSSAVFWSEHHLWDKSQVEIVLGRTIPGDETDSSSLGYVIGSPSMEWSSRSDDGRRRRNDDQGSRYQTEERWSSLEINPNKSGYISSSSTQHYSV